MGDEAVADAAVLDRRLSEILGVDLNLLAPLLALLEDKSVSSAAKRVGLSQPAMSHILARSRRLLHDDLLVRTGNSMTATPVALRILDPLRNLIGQVDEVLDLSVFRPESDTRTIGVSVTTSTALVLGGPLLTLLAADAPNITLRLVISPSHFPDSLFSKADIDLTLLADGVPCAFPRSRLYNDDWVVVADPIHAGPFAASAASLDMLRERPHIAFDSGSLWTPPYIALEQRGVRAKSVIRVSDFLLIPHLVVGTGAIAIVQRRMATYLAPRFGLSVLELPFQSPVLGIDLVWNPRLGRDPMIKWFGALLRRVVAKVDHSDGESALG